MNVEPHYSKKMVVYVLIVKKKRKKEGTNMIYTEIHKVSKSDNIEEYLNYIIGSNNILLRWAIVDVTEEEYIVEASILENEEKKEPWIEELPIRNSKFIVACIIPTGVKASIGGYISDALPIVNTLSNICDKVIVNPNAVNGSFINYARENVLYVEGYSLDNFLKGNIALTEVINNKIGVIIDRGAIETDPDSINMAINTIESLRVIAGIDCIGYTITDEPIGGHAKQMPSGAFSGEVRNPDTLFDAAGKLISKGAQAIAIATYIKIDDVEKNLDKYFKGELANPFGGTEALLSHSVSHVFDIPCAHAPILPKWEKEYYEKVGLVDPRAASEVVSPGYLGCILKGLHRSPQIGMVGDINVNDVKAIIVPYGCCGGIPTFMAQKFSIPLIAVKENKTVLNVTPEKMGMNAIVAENYLEAIGIVAALKSGIAPEMLRRPISRINQIT